MAIIQSGSGAASVTLTGVVAGNSLVAFPFNTQSNGFNDQSVADDQDNLWVQQHEVQQSARRLELWTAVAVAGGDYVIDNIGTGGGKQIAVYEIGADTLKTTSSRSTDFDSTTVACAASGGITESGNLFAIAAGMIRFDSTPTPGTGWTGLDNISWLYTQCKEFASGMSADECEFTINAAKWSVGVVAVLELPTGPVTVKKRRRQPAGIPL